MTVTALIQAFERGGQWRRALAVSRAAPFRLAPGRQGAAWPCMHLIGCPGVPCRQPRLLPPRTAPASTHARSTRPAQAFEDMRARGCAPDAIVYTTIIGERLC